MILSAAQTYSKENKNKCHMLEISPNSIMQILVNTRRLIKNVGKSSVSFKEAESHTAP